MHSLTATLLATVLLAGCAAAPPAKPDLAALRQQVVDTETAFAGTLAARDHAAFMTFLAEDTVWFSGKAVLRGPAAVAKQWKPFFDGPKAPFSWKPEEVEVLDSGTLAISSGPVFDPEGKQVAVYNSIWRLEGPGRWRIVFDKGSCVCGKGQ